MKRVYQKENKIILIVFILIVFIFAALFAGRNYIFNYFNEIAGFEEGSPGSSQEVVDKKFDIQEKDILDTSLLEKREFQNFEKYNISLPELKVNKKNPFRTAGSGD